MSRHYGTLISQFSVMPFNCNVVDRKFGTVFFGRGALDILKSNSDTHEFLGGTDCDSEEVRWAASRL